ncbi:MAG: serine/threonine protein phosphatase [Solirubrobacterales bacterium]|jgi:Icc-related predicted phosphoesterase|nr:serine/threonine protein phosphatase [Solirubrobacterales bacterium]
MRVLAFSDMHRDLDAAASVVERSADADLVIGAGDFASVHEGLEEAVEAFAGAQAPMVLVPGNNETEDALRAAAPSEATVLHGEVTDADGVTLFGLGAGIPITPWDWSFDLSDEEAADRLAGAPKDIDLLVLHSPPKGHCDQSGSGDHLGSEALLAAIERLQPRVAVCGHIHESWGAESRIGETAVYNLGPQGRVIDI